MPPDRHPERADLGRFIAGTLSPLENRRVVSHLLGGCERCRKITAALWQPSRTGITPAALDRALRHVADHEAALEAERREAGELLAELDRYPHSQRMLLALNSRRFRNWFLCERLIERAFKSGLSDPETGLFWAEVAVGIATRLVDRPGESSVDHDLLVRAWSVLGNARRILSDLAGAEEAFAEAFCALERGSGDPVEEADLYLLHGLLQHGRRRFAEAIDSFDHAARLCRLAGDDHLLGKVLTEKARAAGESGDTESMIALLRRAVGLLDPEREPRALLVAQHNLTWALKESGRLDQALATLQEILPLHARSAKAMDLLRLRWLEGKLAQAQGKLGRAEAAFREVRRGFFDRKVPYDAALASLDLAAVLYERDQIGAMKRLAAESLPVFRALGVHREALAALAMFEEAVRRERVSLRWIAELAAYLRRARGNPRLAFKPPAAV